MKDTEHKPAAPVTDIAGGYHIDSLTLRLEGMRFHAHHGVDPQERVAGQDFTVAVRAKLIADPCALDGDRLEGTVDYAAVYALVRREMERPSRLVEHVAARIARAVLDAFATVTEVSVSVMKDNPPARADCRGMGVELTARR